MAVFESMFHQVRVTKSDIDFPHFLCWLDRDIEGNPLDLWHACALIPGLFFQKFSLSRGLVEFKTFLNWQTLVFHTVTWRMSQWRTQSCLKPSTILPKHISNLLLNHIHVRQKLRSCPSVKDISSVVKVHHKSYFKMWDLQAFEK